MDELLKIWDKTTERLKDNLDAAIIDTWITPLKPKSHDGHTIVIEAPDVFFKDWVTQHYKDILQKAVAQVLSQDTLLTFTASATTAEAKKDKPSFSPLKISSNTTNAQGLNPRYTFENFVIGASNRHAHAYSLAVADAPAKSYNPLFIYGGVGLGKTHLIQAICHHIIKNKKEAGLKICYTSSERFTNELIDAIQHHSTAGFRQKYRNMDILVIDDINFIAGKESTQEEFFHTFNTLYDSHKQIIISSDRPPKEISNLQERLVSRFSWGLTTDIQPPDLETRVAILKKKIEREPVSIPDDVIFFIAQMIKTNIRELEGALVRIIAYALLEEKSITIDLAKEVFKDLLKEPQKLITVDFIQRCVAEDFGITLYDLKTKRRSKTIVLPRQIAMYLSRELTDLSLPEIGNFFGGKDHTTVLHSYNKIKDALDKNEVYKDRVERIIKVITQ